MEDKSRLGDLFEEAADRPPRRTAVARLDRFGPCAPDALVIASAAATGRDVVEMLRRLA